MHKIYGKNAAVSVDFYTQKRYYIKGSMSFHIKEATL